MAVGIFCIDFDALPRTLLSEAGQRSPVSLDKDILGKRMATGSYTNNEVRAFWSKLKPLPGQEIWKDCQKVLRHYTIFVGNVLILRATFGNLLTFSYPGISRADSVLSNFGSERLSPLNIVTP